MKTSIPRGWFKKFSKAKKVKVVKPNPNVSQIVKTFSGKLKKPLGKTIEIEHRGSTALGISGQGEVDLYLRVKNRKEFDKIFAKLEKYFSKPGNYYPDEPRARFNYVFKGTEFEIMLVLKKACDEIEGRLFFDYMKKHPELLKKYEALKRKYSKISKYKYQIAKHRFINGILRLAQKD